MSRRTSVGFKGSQDLTSPKAYSTNSFRQAPRTANSRRPGRNDSLTDPSSAQKTGMDRVSQNSQLSKRVSDPATFSRLTKQKLRPTTAER